MRTNKKSNNKKTETKTGCIAHLHELEEVLVGLSSALTNDLVDVADAVRDRAQQVREEEHQAFTLSREPAKKSAETGKKDRQCYAMMRGRVLMFSPRTTPNPNMRGVPTLL